MDEASYQLCARTSWQDGAPFQLRKGLIHLLDNSYHGLPTLHTALVTNRNLKFPHNMMALFNAVIIANTFDGVS